MSRRSLSNILSNEELSLSEVWDWYEFQRALNIDEIKRVRDAISRNVDLSTSRYAALTREELDDTFADQLYELDQAAMFGMLASAEAALRVDFINRVRNKEKDDVSRKFWDAYKEQRIEKIRFEEEVLDVWRDFGPDARTKVAVSEFKGALNLRHWLAHGRYWKPKLGRAAGYVPVDVFDICKELLQAVGLLPPDPPAA